MGKNIIPHKLVLSFDTEGDFTEGILVYQVKLDSGEILSKFKTISVRSKMSAPIMNGIFKDAINFAQKQEAANV